jgi:hypothetical protein
MPQRLDEFNKKFVYTETNPENIINARKNALFFRKGEKFYVNHSGNLDGKWELLPLRTVITPPPPLTKLIKYKKPQELWLKTTNGYYNQFKELMPKTGWKFVSYQDVFVKGNPRTLHWVFPVPVDSNDPIGNNKSRSYDENYFYAKIDNKWYRTPITTWLNQAQGGAGPDRDDITYNLPYIDPPRHKPLPTNAHDTSGIELGDQTYDTEYFYIKVSQWKRSRLNIYYDTNKMTRF